jgi:hypothetical protein
MTGTSQAAKAAPEIASQWSSARRVYPIYLEMARELALDAPRCAALESAEGGGDGKGLEQARQWLSAMDERVGVHQLRQFLQSSSALQGEDLGALVRQFLGKKKPSAASRDKLDFLLVQYFSQNAPTELEDQEADLGYVAKALAPLVGPAELKLPAWLNALDRVVESAQSCASLNELLHGGVLERGRKVKAQAGELFYMPISLVAFTRYGYLVRRSFFRLMLADLNKIVEGLGELEERGVESIDCRRAQFSQNEPVGRLRMICQSWKVMFQAEYSSGQPLRMLVDLRAAVDFALGRGGQAESEENALPKKPAVAQPRAGKAEGKAPVAKPAVRHEAAGKPLPQKAAFKSAAAQPGAKFAAAEAETPEFEISQAEPEWNANPAFAGGRKK